jgi:mannose-6-phosphate isomerase-like protein (cupin superfamily)
MNSHVGYVVSGHLTVVTKDGTKKSLGPGESYTIPPGHDAWVEGNEKFVALEIISADTYAKPA